MNLQQNKKILIDLSNAIRAISVAAIERAGSGHPGLPLGMSDVMTVLYHYYIKFNPGNANWQERDRFILSAGHGSMLLYSILYLTGYKDFNLEDIKNFRKLGSKAAGHPESHMHSAIEYTTGPLGQGIASSVGMAIALKKKNIDSKIYCLVGDGCLMEGVSYEAMPIAAHLGLNNLIVLFDDNKITIDGSTSLTISEDQAMKYQAIGWTVIKADGHDFEQINDAFYKAQSSTKPCIIMFNTVIGYGSPNLQGTKNIHGSTLGAVEAELFKNTIGWLHQDFHVPEDILGLWKNAWRRNESKYENTLLRKKDIIVNVIENLSLKFKDTRIDEATRVSSARIIDIIAKDNNFIIGSADLAESNGIKSNNLVAITKTNFTGNFIHYGPREAAMGAIMNGLIKEGYRAVGGTLLVFSDYMRPAIRLSAISSLPAVYIFSHDSIGVGEDGPTHQPIEHLASLRAMPNLIVMRPCDIVEVAEAWQIIIECKNSPVALILSRQSVKQVMQWREENLSKNGAYIIEDYKKSNLEKLTLYASGSEVELIVELSKHLCDYFNVRVVSIISFELFELTDSSYKSKIIDDSHKVGIEFASSFGWSKIIGSDFEKNLFFGMDNYGQSAPFKDVVAHNHLKPEQIQFKIKEHFNV